MAYAATLIPGDGIGPEVTAATVSVLEATGVAFDWDEQQAGVGAYEATGDALPEATVASIERTRLALKGPLTTPVGTGFRSINVRLRQHFDCYANVRPCETLPNTHGPFEGVDLLLYRENTEGLYAGIEYFDERNQIADSINRITRTGSERIIRYAFEDAKRRGRKRLTLVHKANILKESSGMFLRIGREIAADYPDVEFDDRIIDNMAMQLVIRPDEYDAIVTTNMFGDILSDLMSGLVGGLGVTGSANIGEDCALFEAVHGSAPDIAGQGIANPTALVRSGEMMLRYLGEDAAAEAIRQALHDVYSDPSTLTSDLGGDASTSAFGDRVADRVRAVLA
ncbi:isocitrate/isopropylmalate dehydrogenase family protein [Rubrivirga litoralis]|uniref:Isocitrate/isopropylmalate dehydrogenase family protein n=1 Tax=Rubrivirga litoralis TaxID=3075598 RepID=A0ABU3BUB0_9BACT|nr:isocitrate/isopropylmalate dehydrogenase family protein [Rubrivirga sp. F394]MDT0632883.1 isocitrate/isopropylmalate dehydrogenase family protein [Rubrivirga sp. F394]